jgi:hypothetical protein
VSPRHERGARPYGQGAAFTGAARGLAHSAVRYHQVAYRIERIENVERIENGKEPDHGYRASSLHRQ